MIYDKPFTLFFELVYNNAKAVFITDEQYNHP